MTEKVVKNNSKGYGYNYASLSDIAMQGYDIPKMKTGTDEITGRDYIFYYDSELKEWIRGAEIVIPESKGMNASQLYGSALTYSRRYSVLMALGLSCDDDKEIENLKENNQEDYQDVKASEKQVKMLRDLYTEDGIQKIIEHYNIQSLEDLNKNLASKLISNKLEKKNENNK